MIYIVEDDAAIRELEQYALQSSGYEVASFESSEPFWQAMHAAEEQNRIRWSSCRPAGGRYGGL